MEISGECIFHNPPVLVAPTEATPHRHALYLSNIDDQCFLHFPIQYIYVFTGALDVNALKIALSRAFVDSYPPAGRLRASDEHDGKLVIDCNAKGALFAKGFLAGITAREFMLGCAKPHESQSFLCTPPLRIQVTHLSCGGTILCTAISHCVSDGFGAAHFLRAWAHAATSSELDNMHPAAPPFHDRRALAPRCPPRIAFAHPEYTVNSDGDAATMEAAWRLFAPPLSPVSVTFTAANVAWLKKIYATASSSVRGCTSFEALAAHVWRAWVRALDPPASLRVKLLFTMDVRRLLVKEPKLPGEYCGNGFVLACAESAAGELVAAAPHAAKEVQECKKRIDDDYVRSVIDLLEVRRGCTTFTISSLTRLGLEDIDFGAGRPIHFGPLTSEIYCLFLPVIGDPCGTTALVSVPQAAADAFERWCVDGLDAVDEGGENQLTAVKHLGDGVSTL
uniref:Omega-hydroxypalmitate O-feruloyl transferase n=1 Tax=Leersia perrieri TaxID=77586 RepID=A0A0D9V170_9ORYZ